MNTYPTELPPHTAIAVHRWYTVSLVCVLISLTTVTVLHLQLHYGMSTTRDLQQSEFSGAPEPVRRSLGEVGSPSATAGTTDFRPCAGLVNDDQLPQLNAQRDALTAAYHQHQNLAPVLHASMTHITPQLHLTSTSIQRYTSLCFVGTALHPSDVVAFIHLLGTTGFPHAHACKIHKGTSAHFPFNFTISVEKQLL